MLATWTIESFTPHLGEVFMLNTAPGETIPLVLKETELLDIARPRGDMTPTRQPFSLHFQGPVQPILSQRTYSFSHASLGDFEIFIVPLGPKDGGMTYEAIFT